MTSLRALVRRYLASGFTAGDMSRSGYRASSASSGSPTPCPPPRPGLEVLLTPVLLGSLTVLSVAVQFDYPFPWRRYPMELARWSPVDR